VELIGVDGEHAAVRGTVVVGGALNLALRLVLLELVERWERIVKLFCYLVKELIGSFFGMKTLVRWNLLRHELIVWRMASLNCFKLAVVELLILQWFLIDILSELLVAIAGGIKQVLMATALARLLSWLRVWRSNSCLEHAAVVFTSVWVHLSQLGSTFWGYYDPSVVHELLDTFAATALVWLVTHGLVFCESIVLSELIVAAAAKELLVARLLFWASGKVLFGKPA
jgi:hypothetical protein